MAQSANTEVKAMNKYETIMWEKEMREQILSQACALFVGKYPRGSVFDLIHTITHELGEMDEYTGETYCDTHLVVYKAPGTGQKYKSVLSINKTQNVADGLEDILEEIRVLMGFQIRRDTEHKKNEDLARLEQELKEFREQWVPGR